MTTAQYNTAQMAIAAALRKVRRQAIQPLPMDIIQQAARKVAITQNDAAVIAAVMFHSIATTADATTFEPLLTPDDSDFSDIELGPVTPPAPTVRPPAPMPTPGQSALDRILHT